MKIVCDSCGAKYSIADEKVAGKVFKIRCKKCSAVIVVRGDQMGDAAAADASPETGGEGVWHVVVNGDQQGPFTPAQVGEMLTAGTIDWEAYVWREGFDGWVPAREAQDLVDAVTGGGGAAADPFGASQPAYDAGYAQPAADPFGAAPASSGFGGGGGGGGGGDLFASPSASPFATEPAVANRASRDVGADLFAQSEASPFGGAAAPDDDEPAPRAGGAARPAGGGGGSMTGARNENSVLFSLSNLQALATGPEAGGGGGKPAAAAAPVRAGQATAEGSGLIDIRALAGAAAVPIATSPVGAKDRVDDLLSIGAGTPGLTSSLGAPVLAPVEQEKSNKGLIVAIIGGCTVFAVAAIAIAVILSGKDDDAVAANAPTTTATGAILPAASTNSTGTPTASPTTPDNSGTTATGSAVAAPVPGSTTSAAVEQTAGGNARENANRRERERDRGNNSAPGNSAPSNNSTSQNSAAADPPRANPRSGSIDDLLNAALAPGGQAATKQTGGGRSEGAGSNLPETPDRNAVAAALRSVQGAVGACGNGQSGVATVAVTVSGSTGRVTNAQVSGQFAGTPIGSCVARAVRGASFPRFSRPTFSVTFPYRING